MQNLLRSAVWVGVIGAVSGPASAQVAGTDAGRMSIEDRLSVEVVSTASTFPQEVRGKRGLKFSSQLLSLASR